MDKKQRVKDKNKFRNVLDRNGIDLKTLKKIYRNTPPSSLERLWYRRNVAPSIYYDVLELYSELHKKGWKI